MKRDTPKDCILQSVLLELDSIPNLDETRQKTKRNRRKSLNTNGHISPSTIQANVLYTKKSAFSSFPTADIRKLENFALDTPESSSNEAKDIVFRSTSSLRSSGTIIDDTFILYASQTYCRVSQEAFDSERHQNQDLSVTPLQYIEKAEPLYIVSTGEEPPSDDALLRRLTQEGSTALQSGTAQTPDLPTSSDIIHSDGCTPYKEDSKPLHFSRLFPIFKPRNQRKVLVLIRHGESDYNKADAIQKGYGDPQIFDPHLTDQGKRQCTLLHPKLEKLIKKHGDALWAVSPLTRALESLIACCPFPERLGHNTKSRDGVPINLTITSVISEFLATPGDVGRPASMLQQEFPQFADQLASLNEVWWHTDKKKQNCAAQRKFSSVEPATSRQKRVASFRSWINSRQEKFIIAIGHASFWHKFLDLKTGKQMKNGEMRAIYV